MPHHCTGTSKGGLLTAFHTVEFLFSWSWYSRYLDTLVTEETAPSLEVLVSVTSSTHSESVILLLPGFEWEIVDSINHDTSADIINLYILLSIPYYKNSFISDAARSQGHAQTGLQEGLHWPLCHLETSDSIKFFLINITAVSTHFFVTDIMFLF